MAKQTLEQFLNEHPEIKVFYVKAQTCYDPFTGQPFVRQNRIDVKDWKKYRSYQLFHDSKVKKVEESPHFDCTHLIYVKVPKKKMKQEIINLLL